MKVTLNPIAPINLNFKAIATGNNDSFCDKQWKVAFDVANELRTPQKELDNKTAEDFYKLNFGLDFLILPKPANYNSVELYGTYFYKNCKTGNLTYTNPNTFYIGTYNTQNINNKILKDIQKANTEEPEKALNTKLFGYLALATILYGSFFVMNMSKQKVPSHKALIENADTFIKITDTISNDTAKFSNIYKK